MEKACANSSTSKHSSHGTLSSVEPSVKRGDDLLRGSSETAPLVVSQQSGTTAFESCQGASGEESNGPVILRTE